MPTGNAHTQGRGGFISGGPQQFKDQPAWQAPDSHKHWQQGLGSFGLGPAFNNWDAAARYSFAPAAAYEKQLQPSLDHFRGQMNKDWSGQLFNQSQQAINSQFGSMQAQRKQAGARSGSGGSAGVSPMMQYQLNQEASARSGALGTAARQAVFQAEQMKTHRSRAEFRRGGNQRPRMTE
jgi:hypothetical protein